MKILYADESGNTGTDLDNKNQQIFVLGSLLIDENKWHTINDYFNQKKQEINELFNKIEIHTNEIFSPPHNSIFHIKDWKNNFQTLDNIVDLIISLDLTFSYIAIDKKSFKNLIQKDFGTHIKIDPYIYAFTELYNYTSKTLEDKKEKGIIFLDEIIDIPEALKKIYPTLSENKKSIIEQAVFLKSKDSNFIQIADVFSFYICQYLNIKNGYKKYSDYKTNHCINNYNKFITKTNMKLIL